MRVRTRARGQWSPRGFPLCSKLRLRDCLAGSGGAQESRSLHPPAGLPSLTPAGFGLPASPNSPVLQVRVHVDEKLIGRG